MINTAERVLIVRPSALGDVCRTVPVLASLRRALPKARIDWLVQDSFAAAIEAHPDLTGVVPFARKELGRSAGRGGVLPALRFMEGLRKARYDLVVDCQGLARSGLFTAWTRARTRVGYRDARELAWIGYTKRVDAPATMHTVARMLALVEAIGVPAVRDMRLYVSDAERAAAREQVGAGEYVMMAPTSRWPGKQWPAERFADVADHLTARGMRVVLVGAPKEDEYIVPLLDRTFRHPMVLNLIGETSIGMLMAVIAESRLVIANDSAAVHIAVGFDRPIVALFGPTRVGLVGPYGRERDVIQHLREGDRMDHKDERAGLELMERIGVEEVVRAVEERLEGERVNG